MDELSKLNDIMQTEITNHMSYNKYLLQIQKPELRQMLTQLRDGKMQHITQLQQQIKNLMQGQ